MNPFDQQLRAAKNKQRLLFITVAASFLVGLFIIVVVIMVSRGTRIEIKPDEIAGQATLNVARGFAIIVGETLYSISKQPIIIASADGFREKQQELSNRDFGKVMTITLEPLPAKVEFKTNISDDNISWKINGAEVYVGNHFEYGLDAGEYEFTISHPHYKELKVLFSLARGEVLNKTFDLHAIQGVLTIASMPGNANVSIDMKEEGNTPLDLTLSGGFHKVLVSLINHESIEDTIEISNANPEVSREYHLELKKAVVDMIFKPANGELTVDGILVKPANSLSVEAEIEHRLIYSKKGYFSESKLFNLTAGKKLQLSFDLKKEMGQVEIKSSPEAEILLNDKAIGTTPLDLSLNAVEQKITFSKQGYRSITKTIVPSSSSRKEISVSLVPEKMARLKEAPNHYTNKAGGTLKLFTPNETFVMGAERSELGQRANEFIRNIKLTRAFYAGVHEVTNAEYQSFDSTNNGNPKEPVTSVSWINAAAYCNWLSKLEGLNPVYNIGNNQLLGINTNTDGYRLLTEAEWEWLARKAGKSERTTFVWGNEQLIPKGAVNIADESAKGKVKVFVSKYNDGYSGVAPVGSFTIEKSGLYDQGGNVSEWTNDSYSIVLPEANKVFQDPMDSTIADLHVIKGSNWRSGTVTELRPAFREGLSGSRDDLGFRIGRYVYGGN